jgi:hypothetical protein
MSTSIAYVENQTRVISAEFVKLRIIETSTSTTYTFSTSYKNETIGGVSYTAMGGLIAISNQQRDLKVTGYDTTLTLAGVDPANIAMVLGKPIRGSEVEIYRGFYSTDQQLLDTVKRFTGIVTSYNVTEERITDLDAFTVSINCSSYKTLLENNIGGRRTNRDEWTKLYGNTDTSMDNVEKLNGAYFDFGVPVK